ncbi:hypothetical protein EWM60_14170 [Candidatus Erwinia dacicola]|nr:hypothetical protein [Candidatus Erwinia dacicola]
MQFPKQDLTHVFVTPGQDWPSDLIIAALKKAVSACQSWKLSWELVLAPCVTRFIATFQI